MLINFLNYERSVLANIRCNEIFLCDLNNDGPQDIVGVTPTSCVVFFNDSLGLGNFTRRDIDIMNGGKDVFCGELNDDQLKDIVVLTDSTLRIYFNYFPDSFSVQVIDSTLNVAHTVILTDVSCNTKLDIVVSSEEGMYWYDERLNFTRFPITNDAITGITFCDFNEDTYMDILAHSYSESQILCYINSGGGSFDEKDTIGLCNYPVSGIKWIDIDSDEDNDVIICDNAYGAWKYENDNGNFLFPSMIVEMSGGTDLAIWNYMGRQDILFTYGHPRLTFFIGGVVYCENFIDSIVVDTIELDSSALSDSFKYFSVATGELTGDMFSDIVFSNSDSLLWYHSVRREDIEVSELLVPYYVDGGAFIPITVRIKNLGTVIPYNIPIRLQITSPDDPLYLYVDTERIDSLFPGDSIDYTFSPNWQVPKRYKHYTLEAFLMKSDTNSSNDTVRFNIEVRGEILVIGEQFSQADWDTIGEIFGSFRCLFDKWDVDSMGYPTPRDSIEAWKIILLGTTSRFFKLDSAAVYVLTNWLTSGGKGLFGFGCRFLLELRRGPDSILGKKFATKHGGVYPGVEEATYLWGVEGDTITGSWSPSSHDSIEGNFMISEYANMDLSSSISILTYGDGYEVGATIATRYEDSIEKYKTVWYGANLTGENQSFSNPSERNKFVEKVIEWLKIPSGVNEVNPNYSQNFTISPNPFYGRVYIKFTPNSNLKLCIYDVSGRVVYKKKLLPFISQYEWQGVTTQGENLSPGVYFFKLNSQTKKGVKLK